MLLELALAEFMVNSFAERAKLYWRGWGPLGEPMIAAIDSWAEMQCQYLDRLREAVRKA